MVYIIYMGAIAVLALLLSIFAPLLGRTFASLFLSGAGYDRYPPELPGRVPLSTQRSAQP